MAEPSEWTGTIGRVVLGATRGEGGTRSVQYCIGGSRDLPFLPDEVPCGKRPLIAFEICDDPALWPPVVREQVGDLAGDPAAWAREAEKAYGADLVRLHLTSTHRRQVADLEGVKRTVESVLAATTLPLIIEGSGDPAIDSDVFQRCGEAGAGERLLLGTAEADRYRSIAAAALAYGHAVIAQSPIDINLAKQLNILLREIGVPADRIVIDPYTGALGYGFEYSYSVMERIRFAALKGDADLAMPVLSAAPDSLTVREVRDAAPAERQERALSWEFHAAFPAAVAGADIVCVRHPLSVKRVRDACSALSAGLKGTPAQGGG
ncbi:MAG: acetyl-CoA decarbonylase/synthase complex subunit delta [Methanomicrobiales archaeon]|nr:acetyl-CoA decarbonylase/synthase complex subunit delta [Methanomicrobiales archaeon]